MLFKKLCLPSELLLLKLVLICIASVGPIRNSVRRNFATKSRYHFYDKNEVFETPDGCTALHLNMVLRHGTRYPSKKDIKGMSDLADNINQFFDEDTPKKIGQLSLPWKSRFHYGDKMLSFTGNEEMYNISKRILKRFPSLFIPKYSAERHYFVSTMTPRTSQSASAFAFGLFEGTGHLGPSKFQPVSLMTTSLTDPVLRFFDVCSKYKRKVSKNKVVSLLEFHNFRDGPEIGRVGKAIAERLGVLAHLNITATHLQHMFLSCAYEFAIHGSGQWCNVFKDDELDVMEYLYDIKNYWKRGYGHKINYEISCMLLKNLTESVQDAVSAVETSGSHAHGIFHFSHAETIIPLLCIMGLFNDTEPLLASNYHRQRDRLFRTSNMMPFSGNVGVVLYLCKRDTEKFVDKSFFVQVLVNEKSTALPCCDSKDLCPLQQFLACFESIRKSCNLSKMCHNNHTHEESHSEL